MVNERSGKLGEPVHPFGPGGEGGRDDAIYSSPANLQVWTPHDRSLSFWCRVPCCASGFVETDRSSCARTVCLPRRRGAFFGKPIPESLKAGNVWSISLTRQPWMLCVVVVVVVVVVVRFHS